MNPNDDPNHDVRYIKEISLKSFFAKTLPTKLSDLET